MRSQKKVITYPNNNLWETWLTKELKAVINKKKRTFYSGDPLERRAVSKGVNEEIRRAKIKYKNKIESQYFSGDIKVA